MFTKFLNIFACAAIIACDAGAVAKPLKVKGDIMNKKIVVLAFLFGFLAINISSQENNKFNHYRLKPVDWS